MSDNKTGVGAMAKLGIILALFSMVTCVGLAFVYTGTKDIIAMREQEAMELALQELFPLADTFEDITGVTSPDPTVTIQDGGTYAALRSGELIGVALRTSRHSYSGPIIILVGVGTDNRISGIQILQNVDTPGLGANASSRNFFIDRPNGIRFPDQFTGKLVSDPFIPKQDVVAITASTITTRAVASSVKAAGEAALAWLARQGGVR